MKVLIVDAAEPARIGELLAAASLLTDKPDFVALGQGDIPSAFGTAYRLDECVGANVVAPLSELASSEAYDVVMLSGSLLGTEIAGPLAAKLGAPCIANVCGIKDDLIVERMIYGGKARVQYQLEKKPVVLTIQRKSFEGVELEGAMEGTSLADAVKSIEVLSEKHEEQVGVPLDSAEIVVTGGRGMGDQQSFQTIHELAGILGAAVGASRVAVDEGFAPATSQVGQTGKIIGPKLYIAVGVSGASQHLGGITNAKCVVAINSDEDANIFTRANYGLVCDQRRMLPALMNELKQDH